LDGEDILSRQIILHLSRFFAVTFISAGTASNGKVSVTLVTVLETQKE
jgi:hypothetical protein